MNRHERRKTVAVQREQLNKAAKPRSTTPQERDAEFISALMVLMSEETKLRAAQDSITLDQALTRVYQHAMFVLAHGFHVGKVPKDLFIAACAEAYDIIEKSPPSPTPEPVMVVPAPPPQYSERELLLREWRQRHQRNHQ